MGRGSKPPPPPPPKAPPPPAEDISAEVIAPTMRQEAARRARMGAYVTRGQKIGAGGQLIGASPIQLANVAAAAQAGRGEKFVAPTRKEYADMIKKNNPSKSEFNNFMTSVYGYENYVKRQKAKKQNRKPISPEGGMVI